MIYTHPQTEFVARFIGRYNLPGCLTQPGRLYINLSLISLFRLNARQISVCIVDCMHNEFAAILGG